MNETTNIIVSNYLYFSCIAVVTGTVFLFGTKKQYGRAKYGGLLFALLLLPCYLSYPQFMLFAEKVQPGMLTIINVGFILTFILFCFLLMFGVILLFAKGGTTAVEM